MACLSGARTAAEAAVAVSDGVASSTPWRYVDPLDGTRRRERAGGDRAGQAPGADTDRTQTHGTRGVAGGHSTAPDGGPHVGAPCLAGCYRSGCPLPLSVSSHADVCV